MVDGTALAQARFSQAYTAWKEPGAAARQMFLDLLVGASDRGERALGSAWDGQLKRDGHERGIPVIVALKH
ncbi:hypothetical protein [Streptomyces sp. NPDC059819]|uniref:hypothetical protein n=1 Tax=Streptomyces sp. NPDC059819 TaxID=3346963 RepID=UPI003666396F